jgi:hypothetical protein
VIDLEFAALEREVGMVFRAIGRAAEGQVGSQANRQKLNTDLHR